MEDCIDVIDPSLILFIQENQYDYVSYEDFLSLPMPHGISHEEVWDILSFVRRVHGRPQVEICLKDENNMAQQAFWVATPDMIETFSRLAYVCGSASPLSQDLEKLKKRELLQGLLADEVWALSMRDGLEIEHEDIVAIICGETINSMAPLQVISNTLHVLSDLETAAFEDNLPALTLDTLYSWHHAICQNVPEFPVRPLKTLADEKHYLFQEEHCIEGVIRDINVPSFWGPHQFFGMIVGVDTLVEWRFFAKWDGFLALILWHYACFYHHVPALRFVPFSKMRLDWEHGLLTMDSSLFTHGNAIVSSRYGHDFTPYMQVMTRLLERGVERLQAIVEKAHEQDENSREAIAADGRLTLRQKSLLQQLVDEPNKTFTLVDYQHRFDIALSTARADVEGLVSMRLLEGEFEGKRRVYRSRKN